MLARRDDSETDAGPRDNKRGTERLCVATRTVRPIEELIRFVVGPDGAVVPDLKRKLPGRGVWVTATRAAVDEAARRNAFARSFKAKVQVSPDIAGQVEDLLTRSCLDALAIAHKAGRVAIGFAKVEAALADKAVVCVIHASDAAPDGVRKLAAAVRQRSEARETGEVAVISAFASAQLDLALGRSNVVHAALLAGPAGDGFMTRCQSLERFRAIDPDERLMRGVEKMAAFERKNGQDRN
jgi:predicted RNA-binding protein YlxR (DUF448 family)